MNFHLVFQVDDQPTSSNFNKFKYQKMESNLQRNKGRITFEKQQLFGIQINAI